MINFGDKSTVNIPPVAILRTVWTVYSYKSKAFNIAKSQSSGVERRHVETAEVYELPAISIRRVQQAAGLGHS
jgi:hypothetical protein